MSEHATLCLHSKWLWYHQTFNLLPPTYILSMITHYKEHGFEEHMGKKKVQHKKSSISLSYVYQNYFNKQDSRFFCQITFSIFLSKWVAKHIRNTVTHLYLLLSIIRPWNPSQKLTTVSSSLCLKCCIAGFQASDHRKKFSKKGRNIFSYSTR